MSDEHIIGFFVGCLTAYIGFLLIEGIIQSSKPGLTEYQCRSVIITWCTNCKFNNFESKDPIKESLIRCSNYYFKTKFDTKTDCTSNDVIEFCNGLLK